MGIKTKEPKTKQRRPLAKGQIWKTKDFHVQIVHLGKILVHYKMLTDLRQMRRTQMSRIENMQDYLKTNKARLVRGVSQKPHVLAFSR